MEINIHGTPGNYDQFEQITKWCCEKLELSLRSLEIIFVSDDQLKEMHRDYLDDDTVTDVMTFNLSDDEMIEGEIYISTDRAAAQAIQYKVTEQNELARLIIHGCLHLAGYDDLHQSDRDAMKKRENEMVVSASEFFL